MSMDPQGGGATGKQRPNAGIDVGKHPLDVCIGTDSRRVPNDASGSDEMIAMLVDGQVNLVIVEATGGYERGAVCAMQSAGL